MLYIFVNNFKALNMSNISNIMDNKISMIFFGMISGLVFAPTFFAPALLLLSLLCYQTRKAQNIKQAFGCGFLFGFGHFLSSMYWIAVGVSTYINEFWWAIPFALFGLPVILAFFIAGTTAMSWLSRNSKYFHIIFCTWWIFFEWLRSWIFTGLPWNLLGYSLAFSDILIQPVSIFGIYGLSFVTIYISTSLYYLTDKKGLMVTIPTSLILIIAMIIYGTTRLKTNDTSFSDITFRLVQPSIPQTDKWDEDQFWHNLQTQINLSNREGSVPNLIIWSEAALVVPLKYNIIKNKLIEMLLHTDTTLITGGIADNDKTGNDYEIYTTLMALNEKGRLLFEYHKSHLVPFGEYMPLRNILPIKKLTHGFTDYTEGTPEIMHLEQFNLKIKPLICYEAIFPELVRTSNQFADVIINVTNDAWYGNSSGPYQHLHISRVRAVENGIPMLRVGNNGISAIIDGYGRISSQLALNEIGIIDGFIPNKILSKTIYSSFGNLSSLLAILVVLLIQPGMTLTKRFYDKTLRKT
jgi:apolipoprotein N-acyltransferase